MKRTLSLFNYLASVPTAASLLLGVQEKGKDALVGLLKGTRLEGATSLIDGVGIPSDADGRVTLLVGVAGNVGKPAPTFRGFGEGTAAAPQATSPREAIVDRAREEVQQRGEQVKREAAEAAKKQEEAARRAVEQKGEELRREVEKVVPEKTIRKLKKLF